MKISTKGRYGLRILIDLATHDPAKPRQLHDIAQSQQISEKYISRLVLDLRKAKLIRSTRGVNGGIHLVKSPEEITLLAKCRRNELCPTRDIWVQLNNGIRELTRQITLEDILNTYQRHDAENGIFDYCI